MSKKETIIIVVTTILLVVIISLLSCFIIDSNSKSIKQDVAKPDAKTSFKDTNWFKVPDTDIKIDLNSIKSSKHITGYVNKTNLKEVWEQVPVKDKHNVVGYFVYDCDSAMYLMLVGNEYDADGIDIGGGFDYMSMKDTYIDFKSNWKVLPPDTTGYSVAKYVCGK